MAYCLFFVVNYKRLWVTLVEIDFDASIVIPTVNALVNQCEKLLDPDIAPGASLYQKVCPTRPSTIFSFLTYSIKNMEAPH